MVDLVERLGERVLAWVLPSTTAAAEPCCGGGCSYEYRCTSTGWYQRRWCCTQCSCAKSCTGWTNYQYGC